MTRLRTLSVARLSTCCCPFRRADTASHCSLNDHARHRKAWPKYPAIEEIRSSGSRTTPPWATSATPGGAWCYRPLPGVIHRLGRSASAPIYRVSSVVNDALRHTQATHNDQGALPAQCRRRSLAQRQ